MPLADLDKRALVLFFMIYLCINSVFLYYLQFLDSELNTIQISYDSIVFDSVCCSTLLLGGILATFLIRAHYLFYLSFGCFLLGIAIFEWKAPFTDRGFYWTIELLIGISLGLFKFLYIVALIDQNDRKYIKFNVAFFLFTDCFCYLIVYTFTSNKASDENNTKTYVRRVLAVLGTILVVIGIFLKRFERNSEVIELYGIIKFIRQRKSFYESEYEMINNVGAVHYKKVIISISKSVIVFLLLIPYGICDSQQLYAYAYQSNSLRPPHGNRYFTPDFWSNTITSMIVIMTLLILLSARFLNEKAFDKLYSKMKAKIILGNIFMIISTLICGALETFRLSTRWTANNSSVTSNYKNMTIDKKTYINMSVLCMIPQSILLSFSEILVIPTCIEYVILESEKSTKYFAVALIVSVVNIGGISDFLTVIMEFKNITPSDFDSNKKATLRLDYLMYIISSVSVISLVISILLMVRFKKYFTLDEFNKMEEVNEI